MASKARNGERQAAVDLCLACRPACRAHLAALQHQSADSTALRERIRCVAVMTAIGDLLVRDQDCPVSLLEYAVDLAERLPGDGSACWRACRAAAEAIGDLIDSHYETS